MRRNEKGKVKLCVISKLHSVCVDCVCIYVLSSGKGIKKTQRNGVFGDPSTYLCKYIFVCERRLRHPINEPINI